MTAHATLHRSVRHLFDAIDEQKSDADLLRSYALDRDQGAFETLVRRHSALVFGVARRQLGDRHRAEDILQATFLALARSASRLTGEQSLTNWLHTVAFRQAISLRKSETRRVTFDRQRSLPAHRRTDPLEELSGRELIHAIDEEIERLPEQYRLPLLLCCIEGLSREEAAQRLGWSVGSVKGRLERGRRLLRDRLDKRGISPSLLVLPLVGDRVADPLIVRAAELAASPWASTIPSNIAGLLAGSTGIRATLWVSLCCSLFFGVLAVAGFSKPSVPSRKQPKERSPVVKQDSEPLPEYAVRRLGTNHFRHGMRITSLAVSADGSFALATGGRGPWQSVYRFEMSTGKRTLLLPRGKLELEAVAISPDGKSFAVRQGYETRIFDMKTGKQLVAASAGTAHSRGMNNWITFSSVGSLLALAPLGHHLEFFDARRQKLVRTIRGQHTFTSGAFTPDGKLFAAGGYNHDSEKNYFIGLWDVETGKEVRRFQNGKHGLRTLAISPDGKLLAAGGMDGRVRLWNLETGEPVHQFRDGGTQIWSVAFSPDGKSLAAAGDSIRVYDLNTKRVRAHIRQKAIGLHFLPTSEVLIGAVDGAIYRWDAKTGRSLSRAGLDSGVEQIEFGLGGRVVITHDYAGIVDWMDPTNTVSRLGFSQIPSGREMPRESVVQIWDRATGKRLKRMRLQPQGRIAVTPDGKYLVLSVLDPKLKFTGHAHGSKLKLYDLATHEIVDRFPVHLGGKVLLKEFTPDGKTLVTVSIWDGQILLRDVRTGKLVREFWAHPEEKAKPHYAVTQSRVSPDGRTLAVVHMRYARWANPPVPTPIFLWDLATGKKLHRLEGHVNDILDIAFSADGRYLVSCEETVKDNRGKQSVDAVHVWDTKTGKRIDALPNGLPTRASRVAFSPDGRVLATASFDGSVTLWEVASWSRRAKFQAHGDFITVLRFGEDGTLFTGSSDTTVLEWRHRPKKPTDDLPLSRAWELLRAQESAKAYSAQGAFLASPKETMAFLTKHLVPASAIDRKQVARLLQELESDDFETREKATQQLGDIARHLEAELRAALERTKSADVRQRIERLAGGIAAGRLTAGELRHLRAVEVLELMATPAARALLAKLSKGQRSAVLTRQATNALRRLTRSGN